MKIKEIASLAKKSGTLDLLYMPGNDSKQYIGVGEAIYPLHGLPELNLSTLPRVLDLTDKQMEKITLTEDEVPREIDFSDYASESGALPEPIISIGMGGRVYLPIATSRGLYFLDPAYLKPVSDEESGVYERISSRGELYFTVQHGTFLQAVIYPAEVDLMDMAKRLTALKINIGTRIDGEALQILRAMDSAQENYEIDPDTGEVKEE